MKMTSQSVQERPGNDLNDLICESRVLVLERLWGRAKGASIENCRIEPGCQPVQGETRSYQAPASSRIRTESFAWRLRDVTNQINWEQRPSMLDSAFANLALSVGPFPMCCRLWFIQLRSTCNKMIDMTFLRSVSGQECCCISWVDSTYKKLPEHLQVQRKNFSCTSLRPCWWLACHKCSSCL